MSSVNIKLRKGNFTAFDGYFYTIDQDQDNLLQKTDDGNTSFSYPLDTAISITIESLEYDGVYFWSLEDSGTNDARIRRWKIDNFVCKLQETIDFTESGSHKYESQAFSVEHYHDTLPSPVSSGASSIGLTTYSGHSSLYAGLTLHLGPNTNGEEEDVVINTVTAGGATLVGTVGFDYIATDEVNYYTNIWLFNNHNGLVENVGALYKFDRTGSYISKEASGAYFNVGAATFYKVDSFPEFGYVDALAYVRNSNTLFIDVSSASLPFYGSMVMENIENDEATVIPIYDITMSDQNIYRLQLIGDGSAWSSSLYSYELSSLDSFVTSISLSANPAIIAANLGSTSTVEATVRDQFWAPVDARAVTYSVNDPGGGTDATLLPPNPKDTDSDGKSSVVLKSGDTASEVTVTAVVEQV